MSTRRGLQVVVALIVFVILGAFLDAHGQVKVRCIDGLCVVPENVLRELVKQAAEVDRYAAMCNWTK